jgi:Domain of unknown function (DUF1707)/Domain of unknown function (DUF4190)
MTVGDFAAMRASDADRDQIQSRLNDAYAEGRLTRDEWDERATALGHAATYGELDRLTADLPHPLAVPPSVLAPVPSQPGTNGLAIAALVCALGQLLVGFPASIAAIVLGHKARARIRQTGEQGDGMAQVGLFLGYIGVGAVLLIALTGALFSVLVTAHH